MKKNFYLFSLMAVLALSSCTANYVQIVNVKSPDLNSEEGFVYNDENVSISYDLWSENGNSGFVVKNKTDQIVYIDLTKSFFVKGNTANDYYLNRSYSSANSFSESVSTSWTVKAYGIWYPSLYFGSVANSAAKGNVANYSHGVAYNEKPIVAIPAHCQKSISEYNIINYPIQDCSIKLFPGSKGDTFSYTEKEMPEFSNIITYKVGDKGADNTITNRFYIAGFTNLPEAKAIEKEKVGCKKTGTIKYYTGSNPKSFFIKYTNKISNRYSADAKYENGF